MPSGRQATLIVWFIGMSVLIGLTVWHGADHVGTAMLSAGWASVLVVIARLVAVAIAGAGWWLLFPREQRPSVWLCIGLRFVREGANALLPLAQIGGDFIGARCLALRGVRGTVARIGWASHSGGTPQRECAEDSTRQPGHGMS